ncbi:MAG: NADPH-dependent F420 reductase, partial [Acidobacteriota bacterium]
MITEKDVSAKKETIALIGGTGDLGFGLALRWARAGEQILIGSRDASKAKDAAERVKAAVGSGVPPGISVAGLVNPEAAAQASLVVLTVPFPAQVGILKSIRGSLEGSILIDTTVPLAATLGGKLTRVLGVWQGSAAEQARELAPAATPVLAAFHNLSGIALQDLSATL